MKKLYAIWSVLLVLVISLAVLVPGCEGEGETTGTIEVNATLDGSPRTGAVEYTLTVAGGSPINGSEVPKTFADMDTGDWTCAYVSGGPGTFVNITPAETQNLAAGGTITFTLNFVTIPPPDASIVFESWTINGQQVPPGTYVVGPDTIIDVDYKVHVDGEPPGTVVTVKETSWLWIHYVSGENEVMWLHCVNAPGAVFMTPPATKLSQQCTWWGTPVYYCEEIPLWKCVPELLDVETEWELEICTDYTKTINWLHIPEPNGAEILFDLQAFAVGNYTLVASSCVELEGDENHDNDCTGNSTALYIEYKPVP